MVSISIANREANVKNNRSARFFAATSPTIRRTQRRKKTTRSCWFDELTTQEAWSALLHGEGRWPTLKPRRDTTSSTTVTKTVTVAKKMASRNRLAIS
jgi:hypothetical protein